MGGFLPRELKSLVPEVSLGWGAFFCGKGRSYAIHYIMSKMTKIHFSSTQTPKKGYCFNLFMLVFIDLVI
ncbi:hypothetical protein ACA29_23475 [Lederbergia galactosidilytica]|uniref:Uncharacterized protein n=1 Tax=Lederbergia galactosidilytica TaxID=217031 RepID=A0A0Q9XX83_9BACI|nr:hypothetical protein ACA29_23475 [Lederbergia galactosidilytica]